MTDRNLYAPPTATVGDVFQAGPDGQERLIDNGQTRPAGQGWQWFAAAWRIFKAQALGWWLALIAMFALFIVASLIPIVNIAVVVAFPLLMAGVGACAKSVLLNGKFEIRQIFDGFKKHPGQLLLSGLIYLVLAALLLGAVVLVFGAGAIFTAMFTGNFEERQAASAAMMGGLGLGFFIAYMAGMMVAVSAIMFAPYLIHEHGMKATQAMVMSFKASFKNVASGLVAMLSYFLLAIVATIPLGLGWLVLIPVVCLVGYTAYRDIFISTARG